MCASFKTQSLSTTYSWGSQMLPGYLYQNHREIIIKNVAYSQFCLVPDSNSVGLRGGPWDWYF